MILELPWPPSVNHYWRHVGAKVLISREGRNYRQSIQHLCMARRVASFGRQRLAVRVDAFPPDRRERDLGNLDKALMDSLQHAGVFKSDGQIDDLHLVRMPPAPGGRVVVSIEALP
jgi:crossover junction endodeoxyribonuclease RusA